MHFFLRTHWSFAWLSGFDITRNANLLWMLLLFATELVFVHHRFINADVNRDLGLFQIHGEEPWGTPRRFSSGHQQSECHTSMNHTPATVRKQTIDPCYFASEQEKQNLAGVFACDVSGWSHWMLRALSRTPFLRSRSKKGRQEVRSYDLHWWSDARKPLEDVYFFSLLFLFP